MPVCNLSLEPGSSQYNQSVPIRGSGPTYRTWVSGPTQQMCEAREGDPWHQAHNGYPEDGTSTDHRRYLVDLAPAPRFSLKWSRYVLGRLLSCILRFLTLKRAQSLTSSPTPLLQTCAWRISPWIRIALPRAYGTPSRRQNRPLSQRMPYLHRKSQTPFVCRGCPY